MATDSITVNVSDNSITKRLSVAENDENIIARDTTNEPIRDLDVLNNNASSSVNESDGSPYYVGARAYVTQTESGATVTVIDRKGITTADIANGIDGTTIQIVRW